MSHREQPAWPRCCRTPQLSDFSEVVHVEDRRSERRADSAEREVALGRDVQPVIGGRRDAFLSPKVSCDRTAPVGNHTVSTPDAAVYGLPLPTTNAPLTHHLATISKASTTLNSCQLIEDAGNVSSSSVGNELSTRLSV